MSRANPATTHGNAGIAAWRFKLTDEIHSYEDAAEVHKRLYLGTTPVNMTTDRVKYVHDPRGPERHEYYGYRIGPHMWLADEGDCYAIYLYDTPIIRYYDDRTFSVDNGGFNTPTTLYRLQAVMPDGWIVYHHRKLLRLTKTAANSSGYEDKITVYPATHEKRVRP